MFAQDPSILATLTPAQLAAINSISDDDLAPPPSEEDIFGKTEALKQQFAEDNDRIAQQMAENEVRCSIVQFFNGYNFAVLLSNPHHSMHLWQNKLSLLSLQDFAHHFVLQDRSKQ